VVGVDPVQESQVSTLANLIRTGEYLSPQDLDQAIIGKLLAKNLNVKPGDELTILGQGRDGSIAAAIVQIKGVYSSGLDDFDRSAIHIPLKTFQDVFAMQGAVHEVVVIGESLSDVPSIKAAIVQQLEMRDQSKGLVTLDWQELMPGLVEAIKLDLISGLIFYGILVLVVAFSILNTFLMAIFERTREFGVMMAIGTTPGRLTKLLLIESISLTAIGIVAGMLLGTALTFYFQVHGLDFAGSSELLSQFGITGRMYPKLTLLSLLIGPGLVMAITSLAALYPALKIRRLKPVEALTHA
jgi:ABC-type lipoprotein release transport system permease subunit